MKKFFSMLVAFATIFAFVGCEPDQPETPTTPTKLKKPTALKITEKTASSFTVEWAKVENAASYVVMFQAETYPTTETKYSFTDVEPGQYKVQVMAVAAAGSNYKDSSYAEIDVKIIPADTGDWFTQELTLGTDEEQGWYPTNSIYVTWQGTDVEEVQYGLFPSIILEGVDDATIKANLNVLNQYYEDIASEEGLTLVFDQLDPATEYTVCALATSKWGYEIFVKNTITTESAEMDASVEPWIGTWNVAIDKTMRYFADGQYLGAEILDEPIEKTWTVTFYPQYSNTVMITGISCIFTGEEDMPALGFIDANGNLNLLAGITVSSEYEGYTPTWGASFTIEEYGCGNVVWFPFRGLGQDPETGDDLFYAPYTMELNGTTATSVANNTTLYKKAEDGTETELVATPDSFEIYAISNKGAGAVYGDFSNGGDVRVATGTYTLTKAEAAAPAMSAKKLGVKVKFPEAKLTNTIFVR